MTQEERYMAQALELARQAAEAEDIPVGCVVVKDGRVIGQGYNRRVSGADATAHAELEAIRAACAQVGSWRLDGCELYVTLEPCPMCAGAMVMSQLGACYYGASDPRQGCCGSVYDLPDDPELGSCTQWHAGLLADACGAVLREFLGVRRGSGLQKE